ncbi:MAG: hypothetical protein IBJ15_00265 [Alphaproteobacteria bacterium]|nr:hypothetical protein [Alphaproteobacteria bacterium]
MTPVRNGQPGLAISKTIERWGWAAIVAWIAFYLIVLMAVCWVVVKVAMFFEGVWRFEAERRAENAREAAAIEQRTLELREAFTDTHLRAIARDRLHAIDLDLVLKRACDTPATRVECRAMDAAGVPDRWRRIRVSAEIDRLARGAQ